jgi:gliding motility-associated-like protein
MSLKIMYIRNLMLGFLLLGNSAMLLGQTSLKLSTEPDGLTHKICMKSSANFTGFFALISTSQITVCVPHATGANRYEASDITSPIPNMRWQLSDRIDAPAENPDCDYLFFSFINNTSPTVLFNIVAGQEICLFQFKRKSPCTGGVFLADNKLDPFSPPNSSNINMGNSIAVLGALGETYKGNYEAVPTVVVQASVLSTCAGSPVTFKATVSQPSSVYQYEWFIDNKAFGAASTSPDLVYSFASAAADYFPIVRVKVTVKGADLCKGVTLGGLARIIVKASPESKILYQGPNCVVLPFVLNGQAYPNVQYQWIKDKTNIIGANSVGYSLKENGSYSLKITAVNGCSSTSKEIPLVGVGKAETTSVELGENQKIVAGQRIQLNPTVNNAFSFEWTPNEQVSEIKVKNPFFSPKTTTTYTLTVRSQDGCPARDSLTIEVVPNLEIPQIFTPNNDGINDKWVIYNTQVHTNCQLVIYDRWGGVVYAIDDYQDPWDGSTNAGKVPVGAYIYVVRTPLATYKGMLEIVY